MISKQVIAQLRLTAAQLEVKVADLDVKYPGEAPLTGSRRHRNRARLQDQATGYRRLIELAEKDNEQ